MPRLHACVSNSEAGHREGGFRRGTQSLSRVGASNADGGHKKDGVSSLLRLRLDLGVGRVCIDAAR